jgi:hypothetical protein
MKRHGLRELKGMVFGDLTVVAKVPTPSSQKQRWNCRCSCGKVLTVRHDYLIHTNNPKTHCGCLRKGLPTLEKLTYTSWQSMMLRCYYEGHVSYDKYGGRGILVCEEWKDFRGFFKDMGRRPSKNYSLDRIDPNLGYKPGNARWATSKTQGRNKRNTVMLPHPRSGVIMAAADIADSIGVTYYAFRNRMIKEGKWPKATSQ